MPSLLLLVLTYLGFVSLGLPDAIIGVVWPSVAHHFALPASYLGVVLVSAAAGYLVSSTLAGRLMQALGVGGLLAASGGVVTLSLAGYALAPSWGWFVASAVAAGLGGGAIDAGINAYAARHFSARHMSWLHACWGVGATLGASTAAAVLARGLPWQWTFAILGVATTALAVTFGVFRRAWQDGPAEPEAHAATGAGPTLGGTLKHPLVWAQMLVFLVYCGLEMTTGNWAYVLLTQYRGVGAGEAGTAVTMYWGALTAGRFLLGAIADRLGVHRLLHLAVGTALVGALTFVFAPWPLLAGTGLALLGFSLAPIYPGMMSQTPERLGRLSDHAVGVQAAAGMLGAVAIPSLGGLLLQAHGHAWLNGLVGVLAVTLWVAVAALFWSARVEQHTAGSSQ